MSFVYAENTDQGLSVYCDTKIVFEGYLGASVSQEQLTLIQQYGIVKTTIICPEISISFAGNKVFIASALFKSLYERRHFTTNDVIDAAFEIHKAHKVNDIEFIIASCENQQPSLCCIKGYEVYKDQSFAWIGSPVAHKAFQEFRLKNNEGKASDRTMMAFLDVVGGCPDSSVGGFCISTRYYPSSGSIEYSDSTTFQSCVPQVVLPGECVRFFQSAEQGGFTLRQNQLSIDALLLEIDQMEEAILYTRRHRLNERDTNNERLFSLMLPMVVKWKDGNLMRVR